MKKMEIKTKYKKISKDLNYSSISRYQHLWVGIRLGLWLYHYHHCSVSPLLIYHYRVSLSTNKYESFNDLAVSRSTYIQHIVRSMAAIVGFVWPTFTSAPCPLTFFSVSIYSLFSKLKL